MALRGEAVRCYALANTGNDLLVNLVIPDNTARCHLHHRENCIAQFSSMLALSGTCNASQVLPDRSVFSTTAVVLSLTLALTCL